MNIINFHNNIQYELLEFHYYISSDEVNVVELLLNTKDFNSIEENFSHTFIVEADINTLIFSGYELNEYYEDNESIRVVCIK